MLSGSSHGALRELVAVAGIAKEMKVVQIAFNILPDGHGVHIGYQQIHYRMIFNVKIETFNKKPD